MDFRDLNKASPKDDFSLPHINVLVDNVACSSTCSFMDGFWLQKIMKKQFLSCLGGYSTTRWCHSGWRMQRAMMTLFHDMMHKKIEVYVNDMIVKSKKRESHVQILRKLFKRLRKYKLRLNPTKCSFRVKSRNC